jgi:hypothetical protein
MWVWTQDDELVNLDHVEFVRVEQDEDERDFEVRAYPIQSDQSSDELFYTLAERETQAAAHSILEEVVEALSAATHLLDLRRRP